MEVILQQDVGELGLEGDIVNVAKGYARNFLLPKGMAVEVTPHNLKLLETQRKKIEVKRLKAKEQAEKLKQELEAMVINFSHKAGEEGKLYGSVTSMDIAEQLEQKGIHIDRRKVLLEKPIKTLGEVMVPLRIHPEVTVSITVVVEPEEPTDA
jgi:large subunit ribosomal protein L9